MDRDGDSVTVTNDSFTTDFTKAYICFSAELVDEDQITITVEADGATVGEGYGTDTSDGNLDGALDHSVSVQIAGAVEP